LRRIKNIILTIFGRDMENLKDIINDKGFTFNKALGQNFITDANLLNAIVLDSGTSSDEVVVEIGTGGGTLTRALAAAAKRVISFEVDKRLKDVLDVSLQGLDNVEVVFRDILKMSDGEVEELTGSEAFRVVANLPYYITTPLVMRFIESSLNIKSITVMVQQEVADRFVADVGSPDYAAITLAVKSCAEAHITRKVNRRLFFPVPKVDSAVVHIEIDRDKLKGEDAKLIKKLVRAAFAMRRKTLANNLSSAFKIDKQLAADRIEACGLKAMIRGEALSLDDYIKLSHQFEDIGE